MFGRDKSEPSTSGARVNMVKVIQPMQGSEVQGDEWQSIVNIMRNGRAPMHDAALCGNLELVQWLHAQGASLTAPDSAGYTPFDLAASVWWVSDPGPGNHADVMGWLAAEITIERAAARPL